MSRQLEERLRAWYRDEIASSESASPSLADRVAAIPETVPAGWPAPWPFIRNRRSLTLLLAAMLLLGLLAGAIAVGAGLIRMPVVTDDGPLVLGACQPYIPEGTLLDYEAGSGGPAESERTTISEDGLVIRGPTYRSIEAELTQRRLSPFGTELALRRIAEADLPWGCGWAYAPSEEHRLAARTSEGVLNLDWGQAPYGDVFRALDPEQQLAADALAAFLADLDAELPNEAWLDPTEEPYRPEQWRVHVQFGDSGMKPGDTAEFADGSRLEGANSNFRALTLPDGLTLETLGEPEADDSHFRCGMLSAADAQASSSTCALLAMASESTDAWEVFSEDLTVSYTVQIMAPLPPVQDCSDVAALNVPPVPTPRPHEGTEDLAGVHPCDILADDIVRDLLGDVTGQTTDASYELGGLSKACRYVAPDNPYGAAAVVALRSRSTSADEARRAAEGMLGSGLVEETLGDGLIWLNACVAEGLPCSVAIAGSSEPYFFVITFPTFGPEETPTSELEARGRALAAVLIDRLSAR